MGDDDRVRQACAFLRMLLLRPGEHPFGKARVPRCPSRRPRSHLVRCNLTVGIGGDRLASHPRREDRSPVTVEGVVRATPSAWLTRCGVRPRYG